MSEFVVGLDLGQAQDYTAIAVLEVLRAAGSAQYQARHLDRFPLSTPYPKIVLDVLGMLRGAPLTAATLVVDGTGVGRAVVDLFAPLGRRLQPVAITGGDATSQVDGWWRVPKRELVGVTQVLLQGRRLKIAEGLEHAATLAAELLTFRVAISAGGHDSYAAGTDWRSGKHDDLVLALALAAWYAERVGARWYPFHPGGGAAGWQPRRPKGPDHQTWPVEIKGLLGGR